LSGLFAGSAAFLGFGKLTAMIGRLRRALGIALFRRLHPRVQLGPGVMIVGRLTVGGGPGRVVIGEGCNLESKSGQPNRLNTLARDAVIKIGRISTLTASA
jgi:hypothetical protein